MSKGKGSRIRRYLSINVHRQYCDDTCYLINNDHLDGLYQIFIKSQIKFYRKCVEQGLSDESIAKLMKHFTKQQKQNQK